STSTSTISELDKYLGESVEAFDYNVKFDILAWWKVNNLRFPIVSLMARDLLAIPVSTVASELVFSSSGRVLGSFRSSLSDKSIENLICTQDWLCKVKDKILEEEEDCETIIIDMQCKYVMLYATDHTRQELHPIYHYCWTVTWADLEVPTDGPYTQLAGGPKRWAVVVYIAPVGPMFLGRMLCSRQLSYGRALIEVRANVELKDNIMVAMPKLVGGEDECHMNKNSNVVKNMKNHNQTPRVVSVGPKVGFQPTKQMYRQVSKKNNVSTSGNKKKDV
ncbi:zinc finger BED domain-containing protein RICESLEEPER 2-like protein, partial [Tanacetum coccineum]